MNLIIHQNTPSGTSSPYLSLAPLPWRDVQVTPQGFCTCTCPLISCFAFIRVDFLSPVPGKARHLSIFFLRSPVYSIPFSALSAILVFEFCECPLFESLRRAACVLLDREGADFLRRCIFSHLVGSSTFSDFGFSSGSELSKRPPQDLCWRPPPYLGSQVVSP